MILMNKFNSGKLLFYKKQVMNKKLQNSTYEIIQAQPLVKISS